MKTTISNLTLVNKLHLMNYIPCGRLMDQLEEAGIVGPQNGSKPREVLVQSEMELAQILQNLRDAGKRFE